MKYLIISLTFILISCSADLDKQINNLPKPVIIHDYLYSWHNDIKFRKAVILRDGNNIIHEYFPISNYTIIDYLINNNNINDTILK
jgi:hypothetical protein